MNYSYCRLVDRRVVAMATRGPVVFLISMWTSFLLSQVRESTLFFISRQEGMSSILMQLATAYRGLLCTENN